jgi:transcriptional regulator with XRE-family HTH domain
MIRVSENIKYLRKRNGYTQEQLAELVGIKRSLIGAYEEGRADPRLNNLVKMAEIFEVSLDALINKDVSEVQSQDVAIDGNGSMTSKLRILSITVDKNERENIEFVPQKASAGYLNGFADPEYIEELPKFNLPNLPRNATYRAFEIQGDSMLPILPGTIIIGKYVESLIDVANGRTYVLVTKKEGVVYKRVFNYIAERDRLFLVSDNKIYQPYDISPSEVMEIWEAKAYISLQFPEPDKSKEMTFSQLTDIVFDLRAEVVKIKDTMDK